VTRLRLVLAVTLLTGVAVGARYAASPGSKPTARDRAALESYSHALGPLLRRGGEPVALELRPAVTKVAEHSVPATTLARDAARWTSLFDRLAADLAALSCPPAAQAAHDAFLLSLRTYADAARAFAAVARAPVARWATLAAGVTDAGRRADAAYDQGFDLLNGARHDAGLPPLGATFGT
jgi:hypothetical protein